MRVTGIPDSGGHETLERKGGRPAAHLNANLVGGYSIGAATREVERVAPSLLPPGVSLALGGESAQAADVFGQFAISLGLATLCVVAVLWFLFRSWQDPLVIALSLPLSGVGAMLGLFISRTDFGMASLLGLIFLLGLVNKNAILLVDHANQLRAGGMSLREAILAAGPIRLRPILMTTSATILGMLPIALGFGEGAELRAPMAVAIIGGLVTSTVLSLVVVPVVYAIFDRIHPRFQEARSRRVTRLSILFPICSAVRLTPMHNPDLNHESSPLPCATVRWCLPLPACWPPLPLFAQAAAAPTPGMDSVRAALRADKRQLVAANMVLTTEENAAFWPVYDAYQVELGEAHDPDDQCHQVVRDRVQRQGGHRCRRDAAHQRVHCDRGRPGGTDEGLPVEVRRGAPGDQGGALLPDREQAPRRGQLRARRRDSARSVRFSHAGASRMWRMSGWGRWAVPVAVVLPMVSSPAKAQITEADTGWPREIVTDSGTMIIYQPQPDKLDGITLTGRAAVSVLPTGSKEPVFGVVWFTSRAQTDRDDRTVDIDQIAITNVRFTGESADQALLTRAMVNPKLTHWQFTIALDRLTASLAEAAAEQRSADSLNTTPPAIIFSSSPAALLLYDGQPLLQKVENSQLQRAVNTPMLVLFDAKEKTYYLNGGPLWYSAASALGPWTSQKGKIPADVAALVPDSVQSASPPPGGPPAIVVATSPTELDRHRGTRQVGTGDRHRPTVRHQHRPRRLPHHRQPADVRAARRPMVPRHDRRWAMDVRSPRRAACGFREDSAGIAQGRRARIGSGHDAGR